VYALFSTNKHPWNTCSTQEGTSLHLHNIILIGLAGQVEVKLYQIQVERERKFKGRWKY